jgi:hypothetical protein
LRHEARASDAVGMTSNRVRRRIATEQSIDQACDWPHVTETHKPDDAELFDLLTV